MRLHQSWYRAAVLALPYGPGPRLSSRNSYGNFLTEADGRQGANFVDPRAWRRYLARRGGPNLDADRAERNMLTSQTMCFNLFGPLAEDPDLATRLVGALDIPGGVDRVTEVRVEWAPTPRSDYLGNGSSFDAFIAYVDGAGELAFLGVETKLTESFTQAISSNAVAEGRCAALTQREDSLWLPSAWPTRTDPRWRQLWQNHLLVDALRRHPDAPKGRRGRLALVRHPGDAECAATAADYAATLVDREATFIDLPLDRLVSVWEEAAVADADRRWLAEMDRRYVDLSGSERLWR